MSSAPLQVRPMEIGDLDRLLAIHLAAFPDARGHEARRRNFLVNPFGGPEHLHVAVVDGRIVGHAFLFRMHGWFGGSRVPLGGIASVGVAPELRGRGVATAMLHELHEWSRARGDALTLLYAFRQGFYAARGYAPASPARRLVASPSSIPRAWCDAPPGLTVRAVEGDDAAAVRSLYERVAARATGWLERPSALWDRRLLDERRIWVLAEREGRVCGYASWSPRQEEAHAATHLHVHEIVADDDEARRLLFGQLARQRDHATTFSLAVADDDPIDRALVDGDRFRHGTAEAEHVLGEIVGGPMVRLHDATSALTARGYRHDGELAIEILDAAAPELLHVRVRAGAARVAKGEGRADLACSRSTLAAILFGGLRASDAARLGLARVVEASSAERADAILGTPPFFSADPF